MTKAVRTPDLPYSLFSESSDPAATPAAIKHHKKFFGDEDEDDEATSGAMGQAAALQALQMFTQGAAGGGGGQTKGQFVGLAMSEASKLFDAQSTKGKASPGSDKESTVMRAGEMALKMYLKSQADRGGSSSGGLLGMANKFM